VGGTAPGKFNLTELIIVEVLHELYESCFLTLTTPLEERSQRVDAIIGVAVEAVIS
jgi:hypothetical protein